ncbi:efflux RND transporter permease subunit [Megalodesulfovibrio gigas]|nr:efflux RND transporter permease subunit [Megalodesulfovibrio gigas]
MPPSPLNPITLTIRFFLENRLATVLLALLVLGWGLMVAPFHWDTGGLPRDPVHVDAIPDIGENQQIVFTEWPGRSPQDMEDQVTYPLTVSLLGVPGVKTVRSFSMFGFSSIYVIFNEEVEFYWSRSRLLEKLASLPPGTLPAGVRPTLGPDATALGQVFWYTLEGRDADGTPAGGWDLAELRTIQDYYVRYALLGVEGISEVASAGGFVKEYQVDVDPEALRAAGISLEQVVNAVRQANLDVGARTIEVNGPEYLVRGVGFIKSVEDLQAAVIVARDGVPIRVGDVAQVGLGPALRRGVLDKDGAEAVGGVVVVRQGANPLEAIQRVKEKIKEISPGLPSKTLPDGRVSTVRIVPFYDRTGLIQETLGTLEEALTQQVLITIVVVVLSVLHLSSSLLISSLLPLAIAMCFIAMKIAGVDANIVALSGIAIAIGVMVDVGIVLCENILQHFERAPAGASKIEVIYAAAAEVGGAILTSVATTAVSFLPVFAMEGPEGKLFRPLAFTKTFAMVAAIVVGLTMLPTFASLVMGDRGKDATLRARGLRWGKGGIYLAAGVGAWAWLAWWAGLPLLYLGLRALVTPRLPDRVARAWAVLDNLAAALAIVAVLAAHWMPLGHGESLWRNIGFAGLVIAALMAGFLGMVRIYPWVLGQLLRIKTAFLLLPLLLLGLGALAWLGGPRCFAWLPQEWRQSGVMVAVNHAFPGLGKEFMPPLDEGAFLFMPTTMPHASLSEVHAVLKYQDMAIQAIPEVALAVGKLGRAETPLDPAPVSMIETVINYRDEYARDEQGRLLRFRYDDTREDWYRSLDGAPQPAADGMPYVVQGRFERDETGTLIADDAGQPFRQWRPPLDPARNPGREAWAGIRSPNDIWDAIVAAAEVPGVTGAPRLQPIAARIVMLQSGMRAPMGVKVRGPDLQTIEAVGLRIEALLKEVPSVQAAAVIADRIVGKPYLEIVIDRDAIARYGVRIAQVQAVIETAVGGMPVTYTVEGRERYPVRVRYPRELRDTPEALEKVVVTGSMGEDVPLAQLAHIRYVRGPQMIKSEDTFLTGYVLFDRVPEYPEVDVVEHAKAYLEQRQAAGDLVLPAGVSYAFSGSYENQIRAQQRLAVLLPLCLLLIFLLLYFQFKRISLTMLVFSGVLMAWSGGFLMLWCYGQPWFLDATILGVDLRALFQIHPVNLSVAVWVGFLALFGIATDDGVLMATYLGQQMEGRRFESREALRRAVVEGASRRIRPAMMTTATTMLALLPVLTSTGRGSDIMAPMAIPSFGGMAVAMLTWLTTPIIYCLYEELRHTRRA